MYKIYYSDGPMVGKSTKLPNLEDFYVLENWDYDNRNPPNTVKCRIHTWSETFYRRVPKLAMINLLFGRQAYTASIGEPEPPPEMGEWELVKEADFIDNFDVWFAEKCYEYGLLTDSELW